MIVGSDPAPTVKIAMQSYTFSSTLLGVEAKLVRVEVALSNGLPGLVVVGLPDAAVSEAGARVRSALKASGFPMPPRRVVVNLSPADLRKQGSGFDLALALAILEAFEEIPSGSLERAMVIGELSLDGSVRAVKGLVPAFALAQRTEGLERILFSHEQTEAEHASTSLQLCPLESLRQAVEVLKGEATCSKVSAQRSASKLQGARDLSEVKGQTMARWALEIAAAGGHHLMMSGPPGCGKSLLASCLPGILPPLTPQERLEVAAVASVCQDLGGALERPFRAPGQGTSAVAMLGGQQPGEVTRAHHGVLFLDEFPEFRRDSLEGLRQVMESGRVSVVRARFRVDYPARFTLVAAMNPCPCGMSGSGDCRCNEIQRARYAGKLSGPIRDRFDLMVALERQPLTSYLDEAREPAESSEAVRLRVVAAREVQAQRGVLNRDLAGAKLRQALRLSENDERFCESTGERLRLSVRALEKWLRVARTVADLQGSSQVTKDQLLSALMLRDPVNQEFSGAKGAVGAAAW